MPRKGEHSAVEIVLVETSLLIVHGDAQGYVRSRFCALLLSGVPRKPGNGPPSGGLRRFSTMKKNMNDRTFGLRIYLGH